MEGEDVSGLFEPETNSAALVYLRRLLGCTFDYIWMPGAQRAAGGGGSCAGNEAGDILAALIETFNWAMLAVIAVVATYLIYAALKETANDGQPGGRSMNPHWTLVMAAIGAILCFPAFNGFSALQMGTMQMAVWATGLGDNIWRRAAEEMASADTANAAFKSQPQEGFIWTEPGSESALRGQIADALYTRLEGELCARLMTLSADNMATTGDIANTSVLSPERMTSDGSTTAERTLYYQSGAGLNNSAGNCGSVTARYLAKAITASDAKQQSSIISTANGDQAANIAVAASELRVAAARATASAALTNIQSAAAELVSRLFPADTRGLPTSQRKYGADEMELINRTVNDVIAKTKQAGGDTLKAAPDRLQQATAAAMTGQRENGWMYAVLYQRTIANGTAALADVGNGGMTLQTVPADRDFSTTWGCWNIFDRSGSRCSGQFDVFFQTYSREIAALDQLKPAFSAAGGGGSGLGTNSSSSDPTANADPGFVARQLHKFMTSIAHVDNSPDWRDPIPQIQTSGQNIMLTGGAVLAVSGAATVGADFIKVPFANKIIAGFGGLISPLGWGLLAIGMIMAYVLAWLPVFYFVLAAFSWLVLALQTIISAPLVLMQMFYPNRQSGIGGTSLARMLVVLLQLLLRPALIIIGLIFCMAIMRVGVDFANAVAFNAMATAGLASSSITTSFLNIAGVVFAMMAYLMLLFVTVTVSCGLIDGVGDFVMNMVENGAAAYGQTYGRHHAESGMGNPTGMLTAAALMAGMRSSTSLAGTAARNRITKDTPSDKPRLPRR